MVSIFSIKRYVVTFIFSVVLSLLAVFLLVQATTFIDADSVGVATATPGTALGVKGAGLFDGFVAANYFTSTSTNSSWFLGNLGIGTTTPGQKLSVGGFALIKGNLNIEATSTASSFYATGTLAVASSSPGSGVNLAVTGQSVFGGNVSITENLDVQGLINVGASGTTTFAGGVDAAGLASSKGLTITGGDILSSGKLMITSVATSSFSATSTFTGIQVSATGSLISEIRVYRELIDPGSVAINSQSIQTFTIQGLETNDAVYVNPGGNFPTQCVIAMVRVSAENTLTVVFQNTGPPPGTACDPAETQWTITAIRTK